MNSALEYSHLLPGTSPILDRIVLLHGDLLAHIEVLVRVPNTTPPPQRSWRGTANTAHSTGGASFGIVAEASPLLVGHFGGIHD
jgi:hypothetical protein